MLSTDWLPAFPTTEVHERYAGQVGLEPTILGLTGRSYIPLKLLANIVEVVGFEPTRLSDLIYSQASQPIAQHFQLYTL